MREAYRLRSWIARRLLADSRIRAFRPYHTLDHAWEMEDKDLSARDGA